MKLNDRQKNLLQKILKVVKNKYFIIIVLFVLISTLVHDNSNVFYMMKTRKQLNELQSQKEHYQHEIEKDSLNVIRINRNRQEAERFGREKYLMKRPDEDIYIIKSESEALQDTAE